jgi:hypothetical protein
VASLVLSSNSTSSSESTEKQEFNLEAQSLQVDGFIWFGAISGSLVQM